MYNDGIDRSNRRKQSGEDFTPTALVFDILYQLSAPKVDRDKARANRRRKIKRTNPVFNMVNTEVWQDSTKKWIDPACGNGQFLYIIMRVLRKCNKELRERFPNQKERQDWIVANMIYGIDLMPDNAIATCKRLGIDKNPLVAVYKPNGGKWTKYKSGTVDHAIIVCANTLKCNLETIFTKEYRKNKRKRDGEAEKQQKKKIAA